MDTYAGGWSLLIVGIFECVAVAWVYGGLCNELPGCMVGYVTSYLGVWWVM